jgi:hypothetical protein
MKLTGNNRTTRGKTCPSATLSTTNPTWTAPGSNPVLRGGRPVANRLSHGTAKFITYYSVNTIKVSLCHTKFLTLKLRIVKCLSVVKLEYHGNNIERIPNY